MIGDVVDRQSSALIPEIDLDSSFGIQASQPLDGEALSLLPMHDADVLDPLLGVLCPDATSPDEMRRELLEPLHDLLRRPNICHVVTALVRLLTLITLYPRH